VKLESVRWQSKLLGALSEEGLAFFESLAGPVSLTQGEVLFAEDGPADTFYLISAGKIGLEITSPGKEPIVIQTLAPGDLVGLSWFFPPYRWNWRARAIVDSELVAFDAVAVRNRCERDLDLAVVVLRILAEETAVRLHRARIQLLDLYREA
jgi:CRP/FNR family cyclic AMP-dependent transcriptional regulator